MTLSDHFLSFPGRLLVEVEGVPRQYVRGSDTFAVHGPLPSDLRDSVLYAFEDPVIHVCQGDFSKVANHFTDLVVTPVYRLESDGTQAVPSGRIFIRFRPEIAVESRKKDLKTCGFFISRILSYAPQAAWLESLDGNIATALRKFAKLQELQDVALVEPQMLMRRVQRSSSGPPLIP